MLDSSSTRTVVRPCFIPPIGLVAAIDAMEKEQAKNRTLRMTWTSRCLTKQPTIKTSRSYTVNCTERLKQMLGILFGWAKVFG